MKVAIVTPVFFPYLSGIGTVARSEALGLGNLGHDVTVLTPLYSIEDTAETPRDKYKIKRLRPCFKFGNAAWLPQLKGELADFDIVHLHYPFIGGVRGVLDCKKPVVATYHMDLVGKGWKKYFFKVYNYFTLPRLVKKAKNIVFSSWDYVQKGQLKKYIVQEPKKFVEAPFGVDTSIEQKTQISIRAFEELKRKLGLKDGDKLLVFVGGLDKAHYFKGVDVLLRAFSLLLGQTSSASWRSQLSIVGDGDLRPYYENLARKLRVEKQIIFLGKLDQGELNKVYSTADALVLPSIDSSEAYGLVVLEAMANGLPVVATDLPGVRTNINSERGCLIKPGDAQALAQSLKELLSDDTRRKKMGENAREWVRANRTLSGEIDKLEKVLVDAVSCKL